MADDAVIDLFLLGEVLLIAVFIQFLPRWSRQDLFFAITVPAAFRETPDGRAILRGYRRESALHAVIAAGWIVAGLFVGRFGLAMIGMLWQVGGVFAAFLRARTRVQPHAAAPATVREAEVPPRARQTGAPRALRIAFPLPVAVMAATALYLRQNWARIPERFATHWDFAGEPNGWSTRSIAGVYGPLVIAAAVYGVMWIAGYGILHWSRRISATGRAARQEDRFRLAAATVLFLAGVFIAGLIGWTSLLPLRSNPDASPSMGWMLLATAAFGVTVVVVLVRNRPGRVPAAPGAPVGDRTADRDWKAGMFYVNRNDPALLIEKRFGVGYTLNFGHPWAWILLGTLLLAPWIVVLVVRTL